MRVECLLLSASIIIKKFAVSFVQQGLIKIENCATVSIRKPHSGLLTFVSVWEFVIRLVFNRIKNLLSRAKTHCIYVVDTFCISLTLLEPWGEYHKENWCTGNWRAVNSSGSNTAAVLGTMRTNLPSASPSMWHAKDQCDHGNKRKENKSAIIIHRPFYDYGIYT